LHWTISVYQCAFRSMNHLSGSCWLHYRLLFVVSGIAERLGSDFKSTVSSEAVGSKLKNEFSIFSLVFFTEFLTQFCLLPLLQGPQSGVCGPDDCEIVVNSMLLFAWQCMAVDRPCISCALSNCASPFWLALYFKKMHC
jgi:hypothetical protein